MALALEISASLALASSCIFSLGAVLAARRAQTGRTRTSLFLTGILLGGILGLLVGVGLLREMRSLWLLAPMLAAAGLGIGGISASTRVLIAPRATPAAE